MANKKESLLTIQEVTVMLVTSLCWCLYDGDWFKMLVAESLCWRLFSLCWRFSQCIKSVTNISNLSPTHLVSNIRHQHRCNLMFCYFHCFESQVIWGKFMKLSNRHKWLSRMWWGSKDLNLKKSETKKWTSKNDKIRMLLSGKMMNNYWFLRVSIQRAMAHAVFVHRLWTIVYD